MKEYKGPGIISNTRWKYHRRKGEIVILHHMPNGKVYEEWIKAPICNKCGAIIKENPKRYHVTLGGTITGCLRGFEYYHEECEPK